MNQTKKLLTILFSSILPLIILVSITAIDHEGVNITAKPNAPITNPTLDEIQDLSRTQFYMNLGQIANRDVLYYGTIPGGVIGFGESKVFLWSNECESDLVISFVNANSISPFGQRESTDRINYIFEGGGTYTGIRSYQEILYENIWPGIDARFNLTNDGVKYEFIVAPYSDTGNIILCAEGQRELCITKDSVAFKMDGVRFFDEGLIAYQDGVIIDATFLPLETNMIQFQIGEYDPSKTLIVDPLIYSTYLGGNSGDCIQDIVVDSACNVYVTGMTRSTDFPILDPYNDTYGGEEDCFVSKFDSNGQLVYSTFIGGSDDDRGESIALGSDGCIYITGTTHSTNFPTINALNATFGGDCDVFVLKLNSNGDNLLYSTFIGSNNSEYGRQIVIDVQGDIYVAGTAYGLGLPMVNAYDATFNGTNDAFVFKLDADGDEILYSTYIGGSDHEACRSIALDSEGNLVFLGQTTSRDFPTLNAYDDTYQGEGTDCFILKLNRTGTGLIFSTYVGGSRYDYPIGMDLDSSNNIYVTGRTSSGNFPIVNAYQAAYNGHGDCFVFKLNSAGNELKYSTYVGGWLDDMAFDIAVNESGDVFVGARTRSDDFPTLNAFDRTHNGDYDFVVFQLDSTGMNLKYSTFIGGSDYEWSLYLTTDNAGNIYIAGHTDSFDFPTSNAYDSSHNGWSDCVVFKIYPSPSDGDADRLNDFLIFSGTGGTVFIVLLSVFLGRNKLRILLLSRIPTDPAKRRRIAGYIFGLLVLLLPYGFSYHPDIWADLPWTQREHSIAFGLFAIKTNANGLGFEQFNYHLGIYLLAYIPLMLYLLRIARKIAKGTADFRNVVYTLIVFTIIGFVAFFPSLGPEYGYIPIPLHLPLCLPVARWGIPKEEMDAFEGMESLGKKEDIEEIAPT